MLISLFYTLNFLILFAGLLGFRQGSGEQKFSVALVQALLTLPLLALSYFYLTYHWEAQAVLVVFFSEIIFVLIWFSFALRLGRVVCAPVAHFRLCFSLEVFIGTLFLTLAGYYATLYPTVEIATESLSFSMYGLVYFSNLGVLAVALYAAWRLEEFWRPLNSSSRWEFKFLLVGGFLVCGALAWSSSYRLTYLTIVPRHLQLLSILLLAGWAMMSYAVVHHRLLNRKIFVSRKIVYAFVVPSMLGAYLFSFGMITLLMRAFGLEMSFVLKWLFVAFGFVVVGIFVCSGKIRRRVNFFISTHFYINKYEYRDEWLALSEQLHGASSETEVLQALREVLFESLYTSEIYIWLAGSDPAYGYRLVSAPENVQTTTHHEYHLETGDPLIPYLQSHSFFHIDQKEPNHLWRELKKSKESFLSSLGLVLVTPISIGRQLNGFIGLGREFTGGQYGYDDFDLLTALGSQTASALLAVRMAEELAHTREQQAWHRLSAFVLHDIKNAATMLSLLQENAPEHIHEPEFQQDMLELVGDTLKRMRRIEKRLGTLKEEIAPAWQHLELGQFLLRCLGKLQKKIPTLEITLEGLAEISIRSDPELLASILENLLLNAYEAQGDEAVVHIKMSKDDDEKQVLLEIMDQGSGIAAELLPEVLFEPFKSSKDNGSGIGLWQVKRVVTSLGGTITADNPLEGGARFVMRLPLAGSNG